MCRYRDPPPDGGGRVGWCLEVRLLTGSCLGYRYANHNSYVHFKKLLHDATHPGEDAPPLANASTWFPSDPRDAANSNAPHRTRNHTSANNIDEDDESDLEVTSERISIKCPITLRPMKEPVSSTICPHSFEKTAILEMMERSTITVDGSRWRRGVGKALKCPECGVVSYLPAHPPCCISPAPLSFSGL